MKKSNKDKANRPLYMEKATGGIDYNSLYIMRFVNNSILVILWQHGEIENRTLSIFGPENSVNSDKEIIKKGGVDISKDRQHLRNFLSYVFTSKIIKVK